MAATSTTLADIILTAYPAEEDELVFEDTKGAHSAFRVCRICGQLVLASMALTHIMVIHPVATIDPNRIRSL